MEKKMEFGGGRRRRRGDGCETGKKACLAGEGRQETESRRNG